VITPEVCSKTVSNPVGDAHKVDGIIVSALEDRTDIGDAGKDELDATGWGGGSLQAQRELFLDQAARGAGVLS
jgi:hypothetical protein